MKTYEYNKGRGKKTGIAIEMKEIWYPGIPGDIEKGRHGRKKRAKENEFINYERGRKISI